MEFLVLVSAPVCPLVMSGKMIRMRGARSPRSGG